MEFGLRVGGSGRRGEEETKNEKRISGFVFKMNLSIAIL